MIKLVNDGIIQEMSRISVLRETYGLQLVFIRRRGNKEGYLYNINKSERQEKIPLSTNNIGQIIESIRFEKKLQRKTLCKGLCSESSLLRIENGDRIPDKFMLDALLQRLGKSPDKLETILNVRDYILQELRNEIDIFLLNEDYKSAREKLSKYKGQLESKMPIHMQYMYKVKAILAEEEEGDLEKSFSYLYKAILSTLPDFEVDEKVIWLLSAEEIYLLLMLAQICIRKDLDIAISLLRRLDFYVQYNYTDQKERAKVYPKVLYVLAKALYEKMYYLEMIEVCDKAINILGYSCIIVGLEELLELRIMAEKELNADTQNSHRASQLKALREIYAQYDIKIRSNKTGIWRDAIQKEVFLLHELIHENRLIAKMTQGELAKLVGCEQKAISYMEMGKKAPTNKNFDKIREHLKINQDYYRGFIDTENFEIHEMMIQIGRYNMLEDFQKAREIFDKLKIKLVKDKKENAQYILWMDTILKMKMGKINQINALKRLEQAMSCTIPEYKEENISKYVLSRQEVFILNNIAIAKIPMEGKMKAVKILSSVLEGYKKSCVDMKYHVSGAIIVMFNLACFLEECDYFEEALKIYDEGIKLELSCGKGGVIGRFLGSKAYTLGRSVIKDDITEQNVLSVYEQAFLISELMQDKSACNTIKEKSKR